MKQGEGGSSPGNMRHERIVCESRRLLIQAESFARGEGNNRFSVRAFETTNSGVGSGLPDLLAHSPYPPILYFQKVASLIQNEVKLRNRQMNGGKMEEIDISKW